MTPLRRAWERHALPWLVAAVMRSPSIARERAGLIPRASGLVVEIGVGSGLNFAYYGPAVSGVIGVEPSPLLLRMAARRARGLAAPVRLLEASAEQLPLADGVADTAVSTWTLCSVLDPVRAVEELRRVLRPGGRLLFVEHGRSPDPGVSAWQDRLTPLWSRAAGNCHMNRAIADLVGAAGFRIGDLDASYATGPRPLAYLYRGVAERA